MGTLGVTVADLAPGRVVLDLPVRPEWTQHHGFVHAGIVTTVLDSACGYAAFTLMEAEAEVLTVEFKSNFTAPARGEVIRCTGDVVQAGRTIMVCRGEAVGLTGDEARLVSVMQASMMCLRGRDDLRG